MKKRRKFIINKKFQLKTIFIIIAIVYLFVSIVIATVAVHAIINNNTLLGVIENQKKTISTQQDILQAINIFTKEKNWKTLRLSKNMINQDINTNITILNNNINKVEKLAYNTKIVLYTIITIVIFQGFVLIYVLIKVTHRISGPIYHISQYIKDITQFKYPAIRPLRANDEFKEFHGLVVTMADALKKARKIK